MGKKRGTIYFENIFTNQRMRYSPNPTPKIKTPTTNNIRMVVTFHPSFSLNHPETPKIIIFVFFIV